jgi:hypothetical protein
MAEKRVRRERERERERGQAFARYFTVSTSNIKVKFVWIPKEEN